MRGPNLFIVGAPKAGTTSLYHYLADDARIFFPQIKEPHFFLSAPSRVDIDKETYVGLYTSGQHAAYRGDASPFYLWDPQAAAKIRRWEPEAKAIILLRDPIARAYSHYWMNVVSGVQRRTFLSALVEDMSSKVKGFKISHLYVECGQYAEQVKRYMDEFGMSNVLILESSELLEKPDAIMSQIYEFLGLALERGIVASELYNQALVPRNGMARILLNAERTRAVVKRIVPERIKLSLRPVVFSSRVPPIDDKAARLLQTIFRPEVARLREITGRKLQSLTERW